MAEKFTCYDTADYLKSDEEMVAYLDACIEDDPGDGSLIRVALGTIARAPGNEPTRTRHGHFTRGALSGAACRRQP